MNYHILTGATGLLGRYLLKDLTLHNIPVAVVVRPSRRQSPQERVEAIMQYWDNELGQQLERPVVMEGNICETDMGLSLDSIKWAAENANCMIHNAASLSFVSTGPQSEPWRSNVDGTRNVVEFCKQAGIRKFHHVSTAYVCGLREGVCKETELDVGQEFGNPYEQSKVQAEQMVRNESFFQPPTVHRPGIIIGDAKNGFTTTFHGFYAALQLSCTIARSYNRMNETGKSHADRLRLNLDGNESKNLVPVDWVSEVMAYVMANPEHHGKTYHLTPRHPVTSRLIRDILQVSAESYGTRLVGSNTQLENPNELEQMFYDHFRVYNSYWRNDPTFDTTNTTTAAPHLPCPHVDFELLNKLSKVAIDMNFTWKDRLVRTPTPVAAT